MYHRAMNTDAYLSLLCTANQLKTLPRTGWLQRGVPNAENVAAHSFGVVLAALLLAELVEEPIDMARVLAMAALHDVPEALTSDIPSPVQRFFPAWESSLKTHIEREALHEMTDDLPFAPRWHALWEELHAEQSAESRIVQDADKLDLFVQAYLYEQQTGTRRLAEFWTTPYAFYFAPAQTIYDALRAKRRERSPAD
jgi:putative hydrolase of HD superfamily